MTSSTGDESRLTGLQGWLIFALAVLAIEAIATAFTAWRWLEAGDTRVAAAALVLAAFAGACFVLIVQKKKIARALSALLFGVEIVLCIVLMATVVRIGAVALLPVLARGMLAFGLLLYFVFSRRVRRTLVN